MHISPILAVGIVGAAVAIGTTLWKDRAPNQAFRARARPLVNSWELEMFRRLQAAWPEGLVLVKVALSALISVPLRERERVRHRHVDFVLCDAEMQVYAVVQLEQDEELQEFRTGESAKTLLSNAGYVVLSWSEPPAVSEIEEALVPVRRGGPRRVATGPYAAKPSVD
jgi:hypothetical protein